MIDKLEKHPALINIFDRFLPIFCAGLGISFTFLGSNFMLLNFVCLNKLDFAHVSIELVDPPSVRFSACWPALLCSPRNLSVK